ncbi:hypothetical protein ACTNC1_01730 [Atopobiaceae bacterium HCP3S3_A4]
MPATSESTGDAAEDNSEDQSVFKAYWTNAADSEISYTNDGYNADDPSTWTDYSCVPSSNSNHKSTLRVYMKLAGDPESATYKAGTVRIAVPAGFYRGVVKDNSLLVACEDGSSTGRAMDQISWQIPKAPETNTLSDFNYVEETREVNGQTVTYYVMQNTKDLVGSTELDVAIDYRYRPTMLDVVSQTQADGSDMGIYKASYPVTCTVNDSQVSSVDLGVSVKTKVNDSTLTLAHASQDGNKGVFFTWQDAWGAKPADADKYFYIVWYATYDRATLSTQPYTYKIDIDSSKTDGGEYLGALRVPSQKNYFDRKPFLLEKLDKTYSGIASGASLLDKTWVGITSTPTQVNDYHSTYIDSGDYPANAPFNCVIYELLFRYPISKVTDAVKNGTDMVNDGIKIGNGLTLTETWQDGHTTTRPIAPSGDTSVKSMPNIPYGTKTLEKRHGSTWIYDNAKAAQAFLAQGQDVTLPDFLIHSYNYDDKVTWDSSAGTYRASQGFDITDGDCYLYSASPDFANKAPGTDSISKNDPMRLTDGEYSLASFYVDDSERDISYAEGLGWQAAGAISSDYSRYKPIEIWIRRAGSSDFIKFGEIVRSGKSSYTFTNSLDGSTTEGIGSNKRVSFPSDAVQVEIKQTDDSYFESDVTFHYSITLHADDAVKARLQKDIDAKHASVAGGFSTGTQYVEGDASWTKTGMGETWNIVSYELTPIGSDVQTYFGATKLKDDYVDSERTLQITCSMYNETNVYTRGQSMYKVEKGMMKNYIVTSGVFYCLLPAGTYVKSDEIAVGPRTSWGWNGGSIDEALVPMSEKNVKMVQNWQGTGRTMLEVSVTIPFEQARYLDYWSGVNLNFLLHDSYTNIVDRGGRVPISFLFVNTSDDNVIFKNGAVIDPSHPDRGFADWPYYKDIVEQGWSTNYEAAKASTSIDFGNVTVLQAGFNDRASTENDPSYQKDGTVYLGDEYTDRLQYTAASETRTDDIVLYDVFSSDQENAVGGLESVDVSSVDSKVTYDASNPKTTDTCKPVVYYTTEVPTDATRALDSGIWRTTAPSDLSTVKAVAIDCRKTDAGNDFVLDRKGMLVAYIHLKATQDKGKAGRTETNEADMVRRTFAGTVPAASDVVDTQTEHRDIKLLAAGVSVLKTADPESGTKEKPAEIGNDAGTKLTYTIKITNKAKDTENNKLPDVRDVHVTDVLPDGLSLDSSSTMTIASDALGIKAGTKIDEQSSVSYQVDGQNLAFDVGKLPSGGVVEITIPVVRKDPVGKTTDYFNTATIDRVGKQENYNEGNEHASSTTYHRTTVTKMPLSGASGFGTLMVVGGTVLVVSAVAWVRHRRRDNHE